MDRGELVSAGRDAVGTGAGARLGGRAGMRQSSWGWRGRAGRRKWKLWPETIGKRGCGS